MILVESSFLGLRFALTRVALTVPAIIGMGYLVEKFVKREQIGETEVDSAESMKSVLSRHPNMNCGACGYVDSRAFAEDVVQGEVTMQQCVILAKQAAKEGATVG